MIMPVEESSTPRPVVIDASVWTAFFLTDDVNHIASDTWIDIHTHKGGALYAPSILLTEVAAAISRRTGQPQVAMRAASDISRLTRMYIVPMDATLMRDATSIAAIYKLRGADAVYVALAKQLGISMVSWDNEQLTKPVSIITTSTPYR